LQKAANIVMDREPNGIAEPKKEKSRDHKAVQPVA